MKIPAWQRSVTSPSEEAGETGDDKALMRYMDETESEPGQRKLGPCSKLFSKSTRKVNDPQ